MKKRDLVRRGGKPMKPKEMEVWSGVAVAVWQWQRVHHVNYTLTRDTSRQDVTRRYRPLLFHCPDLSCNPIIFRENAGSSLVVRRSLFQNLGLVFSIITSHTHYVRSVAPPPRNMDAPRI